MRWKWSSPLGSGPSKKQGRTLDLELLSAMDEVSQEAILLKLAMDLPSD